MSNRLKSKRKHRRLSIKRTRQTLNAHGDVLKFARRSLHARCYGAGLCWADLND